MRARRRLAGFGAAAGVIMSVGIGALAGHAAAEEAPPDADAAPADSESPPADEPPPPAPAPTEREQRYADAQRQVDYGNQWAPLVPDDPPPAEPAPDVADVPSVIPEVVHALNASAAAVEPVPVLAHKAGTDVRALLTPTGRTLRSLPGQVEDSIEATAKALPRPETDLDGDTGDGDTPFSPVSTAPVRTNSTPSSTATAKSDLAAAAASSPAASASAAEPWWPATVESYVDQRMAERWRNSPVRGPPTVADALGNDGRTTIWQVAVVVGSEGPQVVITSQRVVVTNAGSALAVATGSGSARATGDQARTSVTQVSVVILRGSGNATVHQNVEVGNRGLAVAASTGAGSSDAVGNSSTTAVDQTAVVLVLGSGNGTVTQSAEVDNAGDAYGLATDRDSSVVGANSNTHVRQTAVVIVRDEDVTVSQGAVVTNHGTARATGGTATGTDANTEVDQTTLQY